ncbi:hypothetical protein OT109_15270 [Phycisphaeraceae bacterium D3-23]
MLNREEIEGKLGPIVDVIDRQRKGERLGGETAERSLFNAHEYEVLIEIICDNLCEEDPWFELSDEQRADLREVASYLDVDRRYWSFLE